MSSVTPEPLFLRRSMVVFGGLGMGCSCHVLAMRVMLERLSHVHDATPAGGYRLV